MPLDYTADMLGTTLSAIFDWYGDAAPQQAESVRVFLDTLDEQQEEPVDQRIQGIASHFDQILEEQGDHRADDITDQFSAEVWAFIVRLASETTPPPL